MAVTKSDRGDQSNDESVMTHLATSGDRCSGEQRSKLFHDAYFRIKSAWIFQKKTRRQLLLRGWLRRFQRRIGPISRRKKFLRFLILIKILGIHVTHVVNRRRPVDQAVNKKKVVRFMGVDRPSIASDGFVKRKSLMTSETESKFINMFVNMRRRCPMWI